MKNLLFFALAGIIVFTSCSPSAVKTVKNLKESINGETTASAKYAAFSQKAMEEGYDTIAKLFDAASKSEAIHAANHKKVLDEMGETMLVNTPMFDVETTEKNVRAAKDGETYEISTMYPDFIKEAKAEKAEKAVKSFTWAFDTEKKHQQFYQLGIEAVAKGSESSMSFEYAVCPVCGNTYEKAKMEDKCGFCMTSKDKFIFI